MTTNIETRHRLRHRGRARGRSMAWQCVAAPVALVVGSMAGMFAVGCGPASPTAVGQPTGNASMDTPDLPFRPALTPISPRVVALEHAPVREAGNGKARVAMLAEGHQAFIGRLELDPGASVPLHRDESEEYLYVLEGSGTITIDGTDYAIGPGCTVFMPAAAEVSFQNGDMKFVCVQVFAGKESAKKYDAWNQKPAGGD